MGTKINFELKSISKGSKSVPLTSIDGWKVEKFPKILVVIERSRKKMKALPRDDGTESKTRDIEVKLGSYYLYYFTKKHVDLFVKWPGKPSLKEVTATYWRENPQFLDRIREVAKKANKSSDAPIKLVAGKNGNLCRIHYVCYNHTILPEPTPKVKKWIAPMIDPIIGARLRLWKDHSNNGGKVGYLDEEMLHWEDREGKKGLGRLEVHFSDGSVKKYPDFKHGRQDFWAGFAIEKILDGLNDELIRTPGGTVGTDFTLDELSDEWKVGSLTRGELKRAARKLGKHFILRNLHERYGIESRESDFSSGGTVTLSGLSRLAIAMAESQQEELGDISTKKRCIGRMLEMRGRSLDPDDVSRGGTITAYSLVKIWF